MNIATTIIPIFAVIFVGWTAHTRGFITREFVGPANRLVFYLAIPALLFQAISKAPLHARFNAAVVLISLLSIVAAFALAWTLGRRLCPLRSQVGTYVQTSFHGNLGYIGLAVAFYYLGDEGLVRASILSGFIILLQNVLAIFVLQLYSGPGDRRGNRLKMAASLAGNPVIIAALLGVVFSLAEIPVPLVFSRSLDILAGLALPMALLVIGASLNFEQIRSRFPVVLSSGIIKLLFLPGTAWIIFRSFHIPVQDYLPALILLGSPTATVSYVMAVEMGGDPEFAGSAISLCTMLSAVTLSFWLRLLG